MSEREEEVLATIVSLVKQLLDPPRMLLFGSRAEGRARKESDFDIAVDGPRPESRKRREVEELIDQKIGLYEMDIVYLESVEESFRCLIEKTGKVIYEREETRGAA